MNVRDPDNWDINIEIPEMHHETYDTHFTTFENVRNDMPVTADFTNIARNPSSIEEEEKFEVTETYARRVTFQVQQEPRRVLFYRPPPLVIDEEFKAEIMNDE